MIDVPIGMIDMPWLSVWHEAASMLHPAAQSVLFSIN
jgi:hypothetical protein